MGAAACAAWRLVEVLTLVTVVEVPLRVRGSARGPAVQCLFTVRYNCFLPFINILDYPKTYKTCTQAQL